MPNKPQSVVVIPNLTGEVFDVAGTSRTENYAMVSVAGLSSPVATNWGSLPPNDVPLQTVSATSNIKSITVVYDGIPDTVAKMARNMSTMEGPAEPGFNQDYDVNYVVTNRDTGTTIRRISDGQEWDASTLDPANAAGWNTWRARIKGQFDGSGRLVGAYESSISQISVFKFSLGGSTSFNGFSPIMVNSGRFLGKELFSLTDNVVFYTKDTTGATVRTSRRGNRLFCRIEVNAPGYAVEYPLCNSSSPIIAIEHVWAFGTSYYIIVLTEAGYKTFVSAPYPNVTEESTRADFSIQSVSYESIVRPESMGTESTQADFSANYVAYIFDPPTPPVPPIIRDTTLVDTVQSTFTATAISHA